MDPYWNREFGFGIVDALAAAELALFLFEANQTESIDPTIQSRGLNLSQTSMINITGHAWGQSGSVDMVEYRIGNGPWFETTYSAHPEGVGALTPFLWHIILDPEKLPEGQHTVEVHASYGNKHSLPTFFEVYGSGPNISSQGIPPVLIGLVLLVAFAWVGVASLREVSVRRRNRGNAPFLWERFGRPYRCRNPGLKSRHLSIRAFQAALFKS